MTTCEGVRGCQQSVLMGIICGKASFYLRRRYMYLPMYVCLSVC